MILSLIIALSAHGAEVDVSRALFERWIAPVPDRPEVGPRPWVARRAVEIEDVEDAARLRVVWSLRTEEPGWMDLPLVDGSVRVDRSTFGGRPVALKSLRDGRRHAVIWVDRSGELVLEGEIVGPLRRGLTLALQPAPLGTVRVTTSDEVVEVSGGTVLRDDARGVFWTGDASFRVATTSVKPAVKSDTVVVGEVGIGVTASDATLSTRARVRWRVVRGEVSTVRFEAPGAGADLEVTGTAVARWTREGSRVAVELREPQSGAVDVDVSWSSSLPNDDETRLPVPVVNPLDVFRVERAIQLAQDGDREMLPDFGGWEALATADLPEIARDLVAGTPTSAWRPTDGSRPDLGLLRFKPVAGPPTLIDVAAYDGALSVDGRLLMRAHYTVRNDRGAFLRVTPPPGARIVGARVGGETASVARDGEDWLIPLLKSVETVQGLLDFPVDVVWMTDGDPFERKVERSLPLPRVDADIAVSRVTLSLPPGWENRLDEGESSSVPRFSEGEGITYGFATNDGKVAEADARFQDAVDAWMKNDFDGAKDALDDLRGMGASNANIDRLSSNIGLVFGDDDKTGSGGQQEALKRRVKEQAQARAQVDVVQQQILLETAEKAYLSGDYDSAESAYGEALSIGENLDRISQSESREWSYSNAQVRQKLEVAKKESKKKRKAAEESNFYDFEDISIAGELVQPDGELILGTDGDVPAADARGGLTKDLLEPVPPGSTYQTSVQEAGGAAEQLRVDETERFVGGEVQEEPDIEESRPMAAPPPPPPAIARGGKKGNRVMYRSRGLRMPSIGARKSAGAPAMAPEPPPYVSDEELDQPEFAPVPEELKPLEVTASALDVVIPRFGEEVLYQQLLLPADADQVVRISAKKTRDRR